MHHFDGFDNEVTIFPLENILQECSSDCELLFHLPEYAALRVLEKIGWQRLSALRERHIL